MKKIKTAVSLVQNFNVIGQGVCAWFNDKQTVRHHLLVITLDISDFKLLHKIQNKKVTAAIGCINNFKLIRNIRYNQYILTANLGQ